MSEKSQLIEHVNPSLLDGEDRVTVVVLQDGEEQRSYEGSVLGQNPYAFDPSPFLPNVIPISLPGFFELAARLIDDAQKREGVDPDKHVKLIEEHPPEPLSICENEIITWRVMKREPAKMNTHATGRPQRASQWYYDLHSRHHPNKVIIVESRPIDHTIEFNCWARTNKAANNRVLWLEKLFVNHSWVFTSQGVERFFWENRGADQNLTSGGQRYYYRPLSFFVRFREFEAKAYPEIRTIDLELSLKS